MYDPHEIYDIFSDSPKENLFGKIAESYRMTHSGVLIDMAQEKYESLRTRCWRLQEVKQDPKFSDPNLIEDIIAFMILQDVLAERSAQEYCTERPDAVQIILAKSNSTFFPEKIRRPNDQPINIGAHISVLVNRLSGYQRSDCLRRLTSGQAELDHQVSTIQAPKFKDLSQDYLYYYVMLSYAYDSLLQSLQKPNALDVPATTCPPQELIEQKYRYTSYAQLIEMADNRLMDLVEGRVSNETLGPLLVELSEILEVAEFYAQALGKEKAQPYRDFDWMHLQTLFHAQKEFFPDGEVGESERILKPFVLHFNQASLAMVQLYTMAILYRNVKEISRLSNPSARAIALPVEELNLLRTNFNFLGNKMRKDDFDQAHPLLQYIVRQSPRFMRVMEMFKHWSNPADRYRESLRFHAILRGMDFYKNQAWR